jgi:hypothetical protein
LHTTNVYDALGRAKQVTKQDGQIVTNSYTGNCMTTTDEAQKARKSCSDGLGRLTRVFEDPAGLNYETDYSYDGLNNLTNVYQKGGSANSCRLRRSTQHLLAVYSLEFEILEFFLDVDSSDGS